jgi:hypothetical protein
MIADNDCPDNYTKALIHFEGADAAVAAVESQQGKVISFVSAAQIDTAQKKFGASSLLLASATSDGINMPDHADWFFDTGPFTIDMQVRFASDKDMVLCGQYVDANNYWYWKYDSVNSKLIFKCVVAAATKADYEVVWNPALATWYHLELARNTTSVYMFIAGTAQVLTETTAIAANSMADFAAILTIGYQNATDYFNGWIDEFRVCKGIARHTATFTDPAYMYIPNGELDVLAYHKETSSRVFGVVKGDFIYVDAAILKCQTGNAFTRAVQCHAVSAGGKIFITNSTDSIKYATIGADIAIPAGLPGAARERIYYHKSRLVAEGGGPTVYGSRAGSGNWVGADAWSASNDAWSCVLPENTKGVIVDWPGIISRL